jgi:hypothetical protein
LPHRPITKPPTNYLPTILPHDRHHALAQTCAETELLALSQVPQIPPICLLINKRYREPGVDQDQCLLLNLDPPFLEHQVAIGLALVLLDEDVVFAPLYSVEAAHDDVVSATEGVTMAVDDRVVLAELGGDFF